MYFYITFYKKYTACRIDTKFIEQFDFIHYNILRIVRFYEYKQNNSFFNKYLKTRKIVKLFDILTKNICTRK